MVKTAEGRPDRVLLVGESNPYSDDPYFALYPKPEGASGYRLAVVILGMTPRAYLDTFDRVDLVHGPWRLSQACGAAAALVSPRRILLGARAAAAHCVAYKPFSLVSGRTAGSDWTGFVWPHPSGRNTSRWTPAAIMLARLQVQELGEATSR